MDEITDALVTFSLAVDGSTLPHRVRREVSRRLVDSIACAHGALDSEPVSALRDLARERAVPDGCRVWGSAVTTSPELAAVTNATAVRFLDYSDYATGSHPSDNIAAVVAACEWVGASVDELVAGLVVSYEVHGEIGRLYLRQRGWDQGTTGVIAATCAAGRVLGLTRPQLANAIGMAASGNVSLAKARRGAIAMWKGIVAPFVSQAALFTACMAARDITGPLDVFSGEYGWFEQVSGGPFTVDGLDASDPSYVFRAGYKHWPVEYDAQPAVWLGQQIRDVVPLDEVAAISVETSEWTRGAIANDPAKWAPTTRETADHSLPYILAVALTKGGVAPEDFADEEVASGRYDRLLACVTVHSADDITSAAESHCTMRATVTTVSGETHDFMSSVPRGNPMSDEEIHRKWKRLVGGSRLAAGGDDLLADLWELEGRRSVRELLAGLSLDA